MGPLNNAYKAAVQGANKMTVNEFVTEFIDGYIASDLDTMSKAFRAEGLKHGDLGYPMVLTTLAGIELLGGLLLPMSSAFTTKNSKHRFLRFWNDYLAQDYPVYGGFGDLFYTLLRSGVVHTYTAKHGVYVTKGSGAPLRYDDVNQQVIIDSNVFAQDFLSTYRKNVLPLLTNVEDATDPSSTSMQAHLDQMMKLYEQSSESEFRNLIPSQESLDAGFAIAFVATPIAGLSGSAGDLPAKPTTTISGMPSPNP